MKKIRFLSILVILLFLSCDNQADTILHDDLQSDVQSAKDFFINEIEDSIHTFSAREGRSRKSLNKNLLWEKAYYKSTSFGQVIIIPLTFDQPLYLPKGDQSLSLDQLTYAMFHKNETGYELYWVTALPDQEFQNNNDGLNAFTGTVFVEDWYGNYIQGFRYGAGSVEKIESDASSRMNGECEVISVFYYSQVCDNNGCGDITCEWSHDEVTCPDGGGGMPPSDNPGDFPPDENGTGGSGDGPDSDNFPNESWEQTFGKLCADINFLYSAQSFTAEIVGLGGTWYNSDLNYAVNVELGVNCIDFPEYYISNTESAANGFSIVFNDARTQIEKELEFGLLDPITISIRSRLIEIITTNLQSKYPGSTFGLGQCQGNIPKTIANYGC